MDQTPGSQTGDYDAADQLQINAGPQDLDIESVLSQHSQFSSEENTEQPQQQQQQHNIEQQQLQQEQDDRLLQMQVLQFSQPRQQPITVITELRILDTDLMLDYVKIATVNTKAPPGKWWVDITAIKTVLDECVKRLHNTFPFKSHHLQGIQYSLIKPVVTYMPFSTTGQPLFRYKYPPSEKEALFAPDIIIKGPIPYAELTIFAELGINITGRPRPTDLDQRLFDDIASLVRRDRRRFSDRPAAPPHYSNNPQHALQEVRHEITCPTTTPTMTTTTTTTATTTPTAGTVQHQTRIQQGGPNPPFATSNPPPLLSLQPTLFQQQQYLQHDLRSRINSAQPQRPQRQQLPSRGQRGFAYGPRGRGQKRFHQTGY